MDFEDKLASLSQDVSSLYEAAPFGSHCVDEDGTYTEINALELAWLGCNREELIGQRKPEEFLTPTSQKKLQQVLAHAGNHGFNDVELDLVSKGGNIRPISINATRCADSHGKPLRPWRTVSFDMTDAHRWRERQRIAAIAFESLTGMYVTDSNGVILQVNQAFTTLTGYNASDVQGKTTRILSSGLHDAAFYQELWTALKTTGQWQGEIHNRRKDGSVFTEWLSISAPGFGQELAKQYVASFFDITANKAYQAEISHMAYFDPLTELPNRRLLHDRLGHALATASRSRLHGAVLYIDLDNFKALNDSHGHEAGDQLLKQVAKRLRVLVREGDSVARMGGDEFVVLLDGLAADAVESARQARHIGEKILHELAQPYQLGDLGFLCTASIGISMLLEQESGTDLLQQADLAMYQAKKAGRNTLRFFNVAMQHAVNAHAALEQDLRSALLRDQFRLHYQPQVNAAGLMVGAETLLRWQHPQRGTVAPADFIALAEESALILSTGHWVLQAACAQLRRWQSRAATRHLTLAVNVSARQFHQDDFVAQVQQVIDQSAIDPAQLKLEITESMVLDVNDAIAKMQALRRLGVKFSLDDFGSGYSSLSSLTRLPLDQLKIDRAFVHNIGHSSTDAIVVQTIIAMGNSLGLEVLAEGVETQAQRDFLQQHGCLCYQGYWFSAALPAGNLEALLTQPLGVRALAFSG